MPLDVFSVTRPNAKLGGADPLELVIEEFAGIVEGTIQRRSVTEGWLPVRKVTGTATVSKDAIGESQLGVVVPGVTPDGTKNQFSKTSVTVDTLVYARSTPPPSCDSPMATSVCSRLRSLRRECRAGSRPSRWARRP